MKRKKVSMTMFVLLGGLFLSACSNQQGDNGSSEQAEQNNKPPHGEERGERPGHPPRGERKGPPKGGHDTEQTKTLAEIGGYNLGDVAADFSLKNVDGSMFSLSSINNAKGYIVVFTCNECPFAK